MQALGKSEILHSPEVMPDDRVAQLISAIGNHEGKALLMLALSASDEDHTQGELHQLLKALPGTQGASLGRSNNQLSWCKYSLAPAGLVEIDATAKPLLTKVTEEGRAAGAPLAALLLEFADTYEVSLAQLFGGSMTGSETSSPEIRFKLIEELLTNPIGANLNDLAVSTGAASQVVVEKHLRKLHNAKLLTYNDFDHAINQPTFQLSNESYAPAANSNLLRRVCFDYIKSHREATHDEITAYCREVMTEYCDALGAKTLQIRISTTLHSLKKYGVITAVAGKQANRMVDVRFSKEQAALWTNLFNRLEAFKRSDSDARDTYERQGRNFLASHDKVSRAVARYTERNLLMNNALAGLALGVIESGETTGTVRDIAKVVSEKHGGAVSHFGIVKILNHLTEQGLLTVHSEGKVKQYVIDQSPTRAT